MPFSEITHRSPNCDAMIAHEQLGVVFHHSVLPFDETITLMTDATRKVSYHCLIAPDGTRCTFVPDAHVAWHAGVSSFRGRPGCNAFMLGLSFAGDTYVTPLTDDQLASALEWLTPRWPLHGWTRDWMTDHRQIAPGRKDDLNPAEWDRLRALLGAQFGR